MTILLPFYFNFGILGLWSGMPNATILIAICFQYIISNIKWKDLAFEIAQRIKNEELELSVLE